MNINKDTIIACETHLMQAKDNLKMCDSDNKNIALDALVKY